FYDRYHAWQPGWESPYQKHLAKFRDLHALGGWSRVTENNVTRTRAPAAREWVELSEDEQKGEGLLFTLADRDGLSVRAFEPAAAEAAVKAGLAEIKDGKLIPTDQGLWDTIGLVSQLQQSVAA